MPQCENVCLFDMDGTLCDYDAAMTRDLTKIMNPCEVGFPMPTHGEDWPDWYQARVDMVRSITGWWLGLEPLQDQFALLHEARRIGFDCHVLTKGSDNIYNAWKEKVEWCKIHLPSDVKVTITQDKGLVYGKVLVDDWPKYVTRWLEYRPRGLVIMPAAPWNKGFYHRNVIHYTGRNLDQAVDALQTAFNREAGEPLVLGQ